ncbi:MAG: hypothetical protein FJ255_09345 [Phycisphaerae bacterium]|nr:hypothetical protein [Phycisphaerae bacterium]
MLMLILPTLGTAWRARLTGCLLLVVSMLGASRAAALCRWQPLDPSTATLPGVAGAGLVVSVAALWGPDGTGPLTPRVVVGGSFAIAGNTPAK